MDHKIAIIGLGYVGLPLAVEFAKKYKVVGFDIDSKRIGELSGGYDRTLEADEAESPERINPGDKVNTLTKIKKVTSGSLLNKVEPDLRKISENYANNELFCLYARGFNGANQGLVIAQERTQTFSPFYDMDFLELCLTIPQQFRMNHRIYIKWIKDKYPGAANYHWEKIGTPLNAKAINIRGKSIPCIPS